LRLCRQNVFFNLNLFALFSLQNIFYSFSFYIYLFFLFIKQNLGVDHSNIFLGDDRGNIAGAKNSDDSCLLSIMVKINFYKIFKNFDK